ncbi:MAG TPA: Fe-S cluster assembly protein SufD [Acidimicrobiales bacterium]|nr:Fe-S cluster assembly protein SufD [Acidimicrobiales bacterium]
MQSPVSFTAEAARSLNGPEWLAERRLGALERFAASPPPAVDEDLWRYGRISELDLETYVPSGTGTAGALPPALEADAWPQSAALLEQVGDRSGLAIVVDGVPVSLDLSGSATQTGTVLGSVFGDPRGALVLDQVTELNSETGKEEHVPDAFDHLADAFLRDALVLSVPARARINHPIVIVHLLGSRKSAELAPAAFPRTVIELGEAAEATVIELFVSADGSLLVVPLVDITVGDAAILSYNAIQQLGAGAWQLGHQRIRAGRDATIRTFTASLGAEYARFRTESVLAGQGGSAELLASYFGDGTQMHDFRTLQEHGAPRTTSDLVFKGAVGGTARSVYSGLIRMRHGAKGANAFQTNRNLVLSDGAHADSVPNLDIEENDVRCSHASAVGQIDREQRFYLESRGVPPAVAERLILLGFFEDLWVRIGAPGIREHLATAVAARLDSVVGGS